VPISAVDAISPAFQHAKEQLLQPFRANQWAKLALVGFLAGELSSGGCNVGSGNFQLPNRSRPDQLLPGPFSHLDPMAYAGLIAGLIITAAVLWILFLYLNSVMRFVLFDSIVNRRCEIGKSWSARHSAALRYFVWQLFVVLSLVVFMIILVGIPAAFGMALGWIRDPKAHIVPLVLGGIVLFFVFFALLILYYLIHVFTKDFVVPQMAMEEISAAEGWRRLLSRINREKGGFAGYVGMKIVMALGAAVVVGIVTALVVLMVLIPAGGLGVLAVFGGKAAGLTWNLYTISIAVVVGCMLLAVILYIVSLVSVPTIVFFPAYALYFFAARYAPLDALLHPAPPAAPPVFYQPLPPPPPEPIG
jgi:hypothetical protein